MRNYFIKISAFRKRKKRGETHLADRRNTVHNNEEHGRSRLEESGARVARQLRDVNGRVASVHINSIRALQLEHLLTKAHSVSVETASDDDDLGVLRRILIGTRHGNVERIATIIQVGGHTVISRTLLVVEPRVPLFRISTASPLAGGEVGVGVGTRDENGRVGKEDGGGVIHSFIGSGRKTSSVPSRAFGSSVIVQGRHVERVLTVRFYDKERLVRATRKRIDDLRPTLYISLP